MVSYWDGQSVHQKGEPMTEVIKYPVRFNDWVLCEFTAFLETPVDITEEPELHEIQTALDSDNNQVKLVVKRKRTNTYEVHLTIGAVWAFAKEVAYYRDHAEECISECMQGDADVRADIRKTLNACVTALANANKVLVSVGQTPIHSYFQ
jgi:hypothetical protein